MIFKKNYRNQQPESRLKRTSKEEKKKHFTQQETISHNAITVLKGYVAFYFLICSIKCSQPSYFLALNMFQSIIRIWSGRFFLVCFGESSFNPWNRNPNNATVLTLNVQQRLFSISLNLYIISHTWCCLHGSRFNFKFACKWICVDFFFLKGQFT